MPYVNIKLAGKVSVKQKKELAKAVTEALEKIVNKPKNYTYIVFEEVDSENWAVGGELLSGD